VTLSVNRNLIPKANGSKLFQDLIALPTEVDIAIVAVVELHDFTQGFASSFRLDRCIRYEVKYTTG
jgi:hypothetical protein